MEKNSYIQVVLELNYWYEDKNMSPIFCIEALSMLASLQIKMVKPPDKRESMEGRPQQVPLQK